MRRAYVQRECTQHVNKRSNPRGSDVTHVHISRIPATLAGRTLLATTHTWYDAIDQTSEKHDRFLAIDISTVVFFERNYRSITDST